MGGNTSAASAQALALKHIKENVHKKMKWSEWHGQHSNFYEYFPLDAFKDKIPQEIKTAKYLYTLEIRGRDTRRTRTQDVTNDPIEGVNNAIN